MSSDAGPDVHLVDDGALERYRIRFSLYKVVLGTMIVGLAGVLIPGAVEFWKLQFEDSRKRYELELAQEHQQREYVKDFLETALSQDIELRIRFAEYFKHLSSGTARSNWDAYHKALFETRNARRMEIGEKSQQIEELRYGSEQRIKKQIEVLNLEREVDWAYAELGYVQSDRSVLPTLAERERDGELAAQNSAAVAVVSSLDAIPGPIKVRGEEDACLHKRFDNFANGNPIHIWDCAQGPDGNKTWIYEPQTGLIRNAEKPQTCLHKREYGWDLGNQIHLWGCAAGTLENKTWLYDETTGQIRSRINPRFCIHKRNGGAANGNPIHLWTCGSTPNENEQWLVTLPG